MTTPDTCKTCGEPVEHVVKYERAGLHRDPGSDSWSPVRGAGGRFTGEREWKHVDRSIFHDIPA